MEIMQGSTEKAPISVGLFCAKRGQCIGSRLCACGICRADPYERSGLDSCTADGCTHIVLDAFCCCYVYTVYTLASV